MSVTDGIGQTPCSLEYYLVCHYNHCRVCIISVSLLAWWVQKLNGVKWIM